MSGFEWWWLIPLFFVELLVSLFPDSLGRRDFGGWSPLTYLVFFVIGYFLATDDRYRNAIEDVRFISLTTSLLSLSAAYFLLSEMGFSGIHPLYLLLRATIAWSCLLTFLGFASHHMNFSNHFQNYANKAVLPFYIMHQTIIVVIGYFIVDWNLAVFPKYLFMMATSLIIIMVLYEFLVRRVNFLRLLFGMKGKSQLHFQMPYLADTSGHEHSGCSANTPVKKLGQSGLEIRSKFV